MAPVYLSIYDLDKVTKQLNKFMKAFNSGVYHAGVEVYRREWCFGQTRDNRTGINWGTPQRHVFHQFREKVYMGETNLSESQVIHLLERGKKEWMGRDYHLFSKNCIDFAAWFLKQLGIEKKIPSFVHSAAKGAQNITNAASTMWRALSYPFVQRETSEMKLRKQRNGAELEACGKILTAAEKQQLKREKEAKKRLKMEQKEQERLLHEMILKQEKEMKMQQMQQEQLASKLRMKGTFLPRSGSLLHAHPFSSPTSPTFSQHSQFQQKTSLLGSGIVENAPFGLADEDEDDTRPPVLHSQTQSKSQNDPQKNFFTSNISESCSDDDSADPSDCDSVSSVILRAILEDSRLRSSDDEKCQDEIDFLEETDQKLMNDIDGFSCPVTSHMEESEFNSDNDDLYGESNNTVTNTHRMRSHSPSHHLSMGLEVGEESEEYGVSNMKLVNQFNGSKIHLMPHVQNQTNSKSASNSQRSLHTLSQSSSALLLCGGEECCNPVVSSDSEFIEPSQFDLSQSSNNSNSMNMSNNYMAMERFGRRTKLSALAPPSVTARHYSEEVIENSKAQEMLWKNLNNNDSNNNNESIGDSKDNNNQSTNFSNNSSEAKKITSQQQLFQQHSAPPRLTQLTNALPSKTV